MTTDELILKAIEKCLEQASDPEQKCLFHWMKAAIQYPSIELFFNEVKQQVKVVAKFHYLHSIKPQRLFILVRNI